MSMGNTLGNIVTLGVAYGITKDIMRKPRKKKRKR